MKHTRNNNFLLNITYNIIYIYIYIYLHTFFSYFSENRRTYIGSSKFMDVLESVYEWLLLHQYYTFPTIRISDTYIDVHHT